MIQLSTHAIIGSSKRYPPLNDNLFGAYSADGNTTDDIAANDGTLQNGVTYATGKIGQAFSFDGVNDFISFADAGWNFTSSFSFSCWVYATTLASEITIISNLTLATGQQKGWDVSITTAGGVRFRTYNAGALRTNIITANSSVTAGTWYNILVTRLVGTRSRVYVNSVLAGSDAVTVDPNYHASSSNNPCNIGVSTIGGVGVYSKYMNGLIDTPDLWSIELDQTKATKLYNNGRGRQYQF